MFADALDPSVHARIQGISKRGIYRDPQGIVHVGQTTQYLPRRRISTTYGTRVLTNDRGCNCIFSACALRWRHNDHDGVSNRLFRRRWKKTSKLRVTGLCAGNSPGPLNSPHKGPVTRKMLPFDDAIMEVLIVECHLAFPVTTLMLYVGVKAINIIIIISSSIQMHWSRPMNCIGPVSYID